MIETPYYREISVQGNGSGGNLPTQNYTDYNIFCLRSRLSRAVKRINASYDILIAFQEIEDRFVQVVKVVVGEKVIDLDLETKARVRRQMEDILNYKPDKCFIFSSDEPIEKIPKYWIETVLPFIVISKTLKPEIYNGELLLDLSDFFENYFPVYSGLYHSILDQIRELYQIGAIVTNSKFAERWDLELVDIEENHRYGLSLYSPNWNDKLLAPDPVKFLLRSELKGQKIPIELSTNDNQRHTITKALREFDVEPVFSTDRFLIPYDEIDQLRLQSSAIFNAYRNSGGTVLAINYLNGDNFEPMANLVKEVFGHRIEVVSYEIIGANYPFVFSWMVPPSLVDFSEIRERLKEISVK